MLRAYIADDGLDQWAPVVADEEVLKAIVTVTYQVHLVRNRRKHFYVDDGELFSKLLRTLVSCCL